MGRREKKIKRVKNSDNHTQKKRILYNLPATPRFSPKGRLVWFIWREIITVKTITGIYLLRRIEKTLNKNLIAMNLKKEKKTVIEVILINGVSTETGE